MDELMQTGEVKIYGTWKGSLWDLVAPLVLILDISLTFNYPWFEQQSLKYSFKSELFQDQYAMINYL